jgi:hypothetical protein
MHAHNGNHVKHTIKCEVTKLDIEAYTNKFRNSVRNTWLHVNNYEEV